MQNRGVGNLKLHPYVEEIPEMRPDEWAAFLADVRKNGIAEPLVVHGSVILDGRHRLKAARECGLKTVPTRAVDLNGETPEDYIDRMAVLRRNLTDDQRAVLALRWQKRRSAKVQGAAGRKARKAQVTKRGDSDTASESPKTDTRAEAAERFNVAERKLRQAKELPAKHRRKVEAGETTLARARKEVKAAKREKALQEQLKAKSSKSPKLYHTTALEFLDTIRGASVDLLLTDPPYMTEIDDIGAFAAEWVPAALAKMKPTGRAYIFHGAYPRERKAYLDVVLADKNFTAELLVWTYRNTIGPKAKMGYHRNLQDIIYLYGPEAPPLDCPAMTERFAVQDVNAPDGRQGDRFHTWQKPDTLAERFIRHSTRPGATIIDPFAGTGTFLLAAARLGRIASGAEVDREIAAIARKRGCR